MSSISSSILTLSSFNLLFFTQVLTVLTTTIKYNEYVTDKGKNISIPCIADGNIIWVKENGNNSTIIQTGKFLIFTNVTTAERGIYVCFSAMPTPTNNTTVIATLSKSHGKVNVNINDSYNTSRGNMDNALHLARWQHHHHQQQQHQTNNEQQVVYRAGILEQQTNKTTLSMSTENLTYARTTSPLPNDRGSSSPTIAIPTLTVTKPTATTLIIPDSRSIIMPQDNLNATMATQPSSSRHDYEELEYQSFQKINLSVRTTPGPVTQLYFKASTILGFLIWRFNKSQSGGYPVRSFTAEYRNVSYREQPYNSSYEHEWSRMDPINIAPNVRQMEVYHLEPNTTYEFRIWANNLLGSGDVVTTNVTTLPETKEEDLIRLIQPDLDNFDPRIWIIAVSIVLGTLVILAIGLCIVLSKECYQSSQMELEDGWDSIELIPNIILNPGFSDSDGPPNGASNFTRTVIFDDDDDYDDDDYKYEQEPTMEKFKRKVSVFFTGPTIKRI